MEDKKHIAWRIYLVYIGFVILMIAVLFKTATIQFEGRSTVFSTTSKGKIPTRIVYSEPRRGEILDENYTPLLTSVAFYDIYFDATVAEQKVFDAEVTDLSKGLSIMFKDKTARDFENNIRRARQRGNRFLLIRRKVTNEQRKRLNELPIFNLGRMKGGLIDNVTTIVRKRPHGELLKRTLGYYKNEDGKEYRVGLEGAFNDFLSGEPGEEVEQKISTGWKKTGQVIKEAVEGADVVTSINKEIQEVAHSELERQLKFEGARSGTVIVMEVKTGFVKAMANLTYSESDKKYYEQFNYAVGTKEVPGSTFKLASLMAGLEDEKFSIDDTVNAYGRYVFRGGVLNDAHEGGYGRITLKRAFEKSSNVIAQVVNRAYKDEPQAFLDRLEEFNLTQPLGVDISGEPTPSISRPGIRGWSALSIPWMAIGYEVQQTPLQTLAFYNAVANNGTFVKPLFVKEIRRGAEVVKRYQPVILRDQICSESTLGIMRSCLEGVMQKGGTGSKLTSSLFSIAGKTGTAQILNAEGKYGEKGQKTYQASFVGYFPAHDPIYSCIVVIAAPTKDYYGAIVAGTVFAAVANKVYASTLKYHKAINEGRSKKHDVPIAFNANKYDLLNVFKRLGVYYDLKNAGEWTTPRSTKYLVELTGRKMQSEQVPNLRGMSAKDAVYLIESKGMVARLKGFGRVSSQSIAAGNPVFKGGVIEINLSER